MCIVIIVWYGSYIYIFTYTKISDQELLYIEPAHITHITKRTRGGQTQKSGVAILTPNRWGFGSQLTSLQSCFIDSSYTVPKTPAYKQKHTLMGDYQEHMHCYIAHFSWITRIWASVWSFRDTKRCSCCEALQKLAKIHNSQVVPCQNASLTTWPVCH